MRLFRFLVYRLVRFRTSANRLWVNKPLIELCYPLLRSGERRCSLRSVLYLSPVTISGYQQRHKSISSHYESCSLPTPAVCPRRVILDRLTRSRRPAHVRFAAIATEFRTAAKRRTVPNSEVAAAFVVSPAIRGEHLQFNGVAPVYLRI